MARFTLLEQLADGEATVDEESGPLIGPTNVWFEPADSAIALDGATLSLQIKHEDGEWVELASLTEIESPVQKIDLAGSSRYHLRVVATDLGAVTDIKVLVG